MTESFPLALLDAGLRGALLAFMVLIAVRLAKDRRAVPAARLVLFLMAGLAVQTMISMPWVEHGPPQVWLAPLIGISVGNSVLFWLFARAMFDDEFTPRPAHAAIWFGAVSLGVAFFVFVVMPQQRALPPFALGLAIAMRWMPLIFAVLAIAAIISNWHADLVEPRRHLRLFVVSTGSVYTLVTGVARLISDDGRLPATMACVDIAMLVFIVGSMALRILTIRLEDLFPNPAIARSLEPPLPTPPTPAPADLLEDRIASRLDQLMAEAHAYRAEGLTVASLAAQLGIPEYRLRRLINQRLGYRNFNAYINRLRLDEAKRALADPAQCELPILTIALSAGFQSIGPFNRAFKADTGLTPTEFRKQNMADL